MCLLPKELLFVRSPLWKVLVGKTGSVLEKMNHENEEFNKQSAKYDVAIDKPFEFVYCAVSLDKAMKRNNLSYAVKMLETMRTYTLIVQALNEDKKIHQFKAYDTLDPSFVEAFLSTYPKQVTSEDLVVSARKLYKVFSETIKRAHYFLWILASKNL
ncbi:aminoglycoside 6-adenylyltransferase [Paucisalibacillus sp. EB02]|uniref:aminoglycoside 6-adenylyltransferase n=1 Tax=Paucisalibacillus sp. EB02 TaxID=1347087 RepID=UPI0012DD3927|nr:aminoglycoside 6-adenylyltransferase [Paucisalibacillus sp. EB02]